ncbi:MAG TPA: flavodoxin family protein [Longimicrobiales bacterium]|nr:flavodoxin family protein [Longimicrobiales bacterium]
MPRRELPVVREGQTDVKLTRHEFAGRFRERFHAPDSDAASDALAALEATAWAAYDEYRKSPRTRKAGAGFADPDFELPVEWLEARERVREAQQRHETAATHRILVVCASPRSDQTCPGEMSKTFRLARVAAEELESGGAEVDFLDLSRLTAEYGRVIHPCKACVSTAMPLCHWPCSCYPNHALGQVNDWMNDLYPRWVAAHGILIVTPVHWYQAPTTLKSMMDRLVCADGGNPDPTSTAGKTPDRAKALELAGWRYPRHLSGRAFAVVVHGDAAGVDALRNALAGWLTDMELVPALGGGVIGRYTGYYEPYATSHDALDDDEAFLEETREAARALLATVPSSRSGTHPARRERRTPRPK